MSNTHNTNYARYVLAVGIFVYLITIILPDGPVYACMRLPRNYILLPGCIITLNLLLIHSYLLAQTTNRPFNPVSVRFEHLVEAHGINRYS